MKKESLVLLLQRLIGLMDSITGLLLVFHPFETLRLMGISSAPTSPAFLSWIGVFVFSIGMSYFLVGGIPRSESSIAAWHFQWKFTALARLAVALFVVVKVIRGELVSGWLSVAATDAVVAIAQLVALRTGIWKGGRS